MCSYDTTEKTWKKTTSELLLLNVFSHCELMQLLVLTSASVSSSVRCSVENLSVSDFLPLPLRNVRLNSVP